MGIHWWDADNPRLLELARERAWKYDRYTEDIDDESDGSIECIFGSTQVALTLRQIDGDAVQVFLNGYCQILAWAIHEKTGLPFVRMDVIQRRGINANYDGWLGHVAIKVADNVYLDIMGLRGFDEMQDDFKEEMTEPLEISGEDFKLFFVDPDFRDEPLSFLDELELLVVQDFADYLIEEYL